MNRDDGEYTRTMNAVLANKDLVKRFKDARSKLSKEKFGVLFDVDDEDAQEFMGVYNEIRQVVTRILGDVSASDVSRLTGEIAEYVSKN